MKNSIIINIRQWENIETNKNHTDITYETTTATTLKRANTTQVRIQKMIDAQISPYNRFKNTQAQQM